MPSTPTTRIRAEKQATAENLNTWGTLVNGALDRFDEAVAGVTSVAISGTSTVLTSTNYAADQARSAVLVFTGTLSGNSTVTVPNAEKSYIIVNNTTQGAYSLTLKTSAGTGYALRPGPQAVYCDATDVYRGDARLDQVPLATAAVALNGQRITGLGTPSASTDACTKAYADGLAAGGTVVGETDPDPDTLAQRDGSGKLDAVAYYAGAGSVSAPAYTFSSDMNTGLRSGGSDILALVTGGSDRVTVASNGDVGIGSAPPTANAEVRYLSVKGPNSGLGYASLRLKSGLSSTNEAFVQSVGASADMQVGTPGIFTLLQNGTFSLGFDSAGAMMVGQNGTTTPGYAGNTATGSALWRAGRLFLSQSEFSNWNMNSDGVLVSICRSGLSVGGIEVSTIGTSFNTSSDYRLKENIVPLTGACARLAALKPSRFNFKVLPGRTFDGFIAHEVAGVVPEAVSGDKDGDRMQSIDQSKIIPLLVAAVQELAARVEALENP